MRKRTRILAARLAACSLSAAMVFTALPPTAVTSYASALEVDLDVEYSILFCTFFFMNDIMIG